jgi:hypothetical protein
VSYGYAEAVFWVQEIYWLYSSADVYGCLEVLAVSYAHKGLVEDSPKRVVEECAR